MFQMNNCAKSFWNPCINVEVMAWTSSSYVHLIFWPSSVTLTFNLSEQMFQITNVPDYFEIMHKCRCCALDKLNLWPFYHLAIKCDLDLQSTYTIVSNEQLCQIILKSMHKCRCYGLDKLNLWPFYHLAFKCDLDFQSTWTNVSNGTSTPQREQLCQIILKPMHKCSSPGAQTKKKRFDNPVDQHIHSCYHRFWPGDISRKAQETHNWPSAHGSNFYRWNAC